MFNVAIVDDEVLFRHFLKTALPWEDLGFTICWEARNGEEALKLVDKSLPDLMLVDITMPFINGMELTEIIKEKYPSTNIILVTGHNEFEYARNALRLGVIDYILKPFSSEELSLTIARVKEKLAIDTTPIFINIDPCIKEYFHYPKTLYSNLTLDLHLYNKKSVEKTLDFIFKDIDKSKFPLSTSHYIYTSLISLCLDFISTKNLSTETIFGNDFSPYDILNQCKTLTEANNHVLNMYNSPFEEIAKTPPSKATILAKKTKEFIDINYSDVDLRIETICKHVYVNESYLRSVFKKELGITINDYITQVRMNKAIDLISKKQIKYSILCQLVGYSDGSYFSKCFKKYYGVTPTEYETLIE